MDIFSFQGFIGEKKKYIEKTTIFYYISHFTFFDDFFGITINV
jgi:hypothetical protein